MVAYTKGKGKTAYPNLRYNLIYGNFFVEICLIAPDVFVTKISQISSMVAHCQEQAGRQHA